MRELRLSTTANADYLACQRRYQLSYIYDLIADKDKDSTRIGGSWHKCHELLELKPGIVCPDCTRHEEICPDCYICNGIGYTPQDSMEAVARYLNYAYAVVPDNKTRDDWETERVTLLYSLSGHRWYYSGAEQRFDVIGSEIKAVVPVINPQTVRKAPKTVFVIKIDRLVRDRASGLVYVWERKSTGHSITSNDYWAGLTQGDQISGYIYGARFAQVSGLLRAYGIKPEDPLIAGAFCDVWHKPDIQPKKVSQEDTKKLIETGEYCGGTFEVKFTPGDITTGTNPDLQLNGKPVVAFQGKSGVSITETPDMFGARLLADIAERPEHYFAQREVSRTDQELEQFQRRLFHIGKQIRYVEKWGLWVCNLRSCESPFYCEFRDLCHSGISVGPDIVPIGYKKKHPQAEEVVLG